MSDDWSKTEQIYIDAAYRLFQSNKTVSLNAVAIEAGKTAGSLRAKRYPELVEEINRLIQLQEANAVKHSEPKFTKQIAVRDEEIKDLQLKYEIALQKVISLEREVFMLRLENQQLNNEKKSEQKPWMEWMDKAK